MSTFKKLIMKHISLLFTLMICSWSFAKSQITITNAAFPKAGDSLQTSTDQTVKGIKMTESGVKEIFDLRSLDATTVNVNYVKNASQGKAFAKFPAAELVEIRGGVEYYINVTDKVYEEIGFAGAATEFLGVDLTTKISPALILRRSPMKFFNLNNTSSATTVTFPLSALPDSIKSQIGQLTALADSIRIKATGTRTDLVDGYGTLKLPIGDYEVLREKRINFSQSDLEAYLKLTKSWISLGGFAGGIQLPAQVKNLIGKDTTTTYHFYGATTKEPLAIVTVDNIDNTKATAVTYKNIKKTIATKDESENAEPTASTRPDIKAMPNPVIDIVNFEMSNLEQGNYTIKIYNLLGMVVWEEQHNVSGSKIVRLDTNNLKKGTYLYSLSNAKGKILATKRLIVLKA
jgi:Secretion system C-terminal sorting domain